MPGKKSKQLTMDELIKYNQEVLIPVFENRVNGIDNKLNKMDARLTNMATQLANTASKSELKALENNLNNFKDKTLTSLDTISNKLDKLLTENTMRNSQEDREKKFHKIVVHHLETGSTSREELAEIKELNVL